MVHITLAAPAAPQIRKGKRNETDLLCCPYRRSPHRHRRRGKRQSTPKVATLTCRPASTGEAAYATTSTNVSVCKPLNMKPIMAMKPIVLAAPNGQEMWEAVQGQFEYGR